MSPWSQPLCSGHSASLRGNPTPDQGLGHGCQAAAGVRCHPRDNTDPSRCLSHAPDPGIFIPEWLRKCSGHIRASLPPAGPPLGPTVSQELPWAQSMTFTGLAWSEARPRRPGPSTRPARLHSQHPPRSRRTGPAGQEQGRPAGLPGQACPILSLGRAPPLGHSQKDRKEELRMRFPSHTARSKTRGPEGKKRSWLQRSQRRASQ